jgi:hypothetical protein
MVIESLVSANNDNGKLCVMLETCLNFSNELHIVMIFNSELIILSALIPEKK